MNNAQQINKQVSALSDEEKRRLALRLCDELFGREHDSANQIIYYTGEVDSNSPVKPRPFKGAQDIDPNCTLSY